MTRLQTRQNNWHKEQNFCMFYGNRIKSTNENCIRIHEISLFLLSHLSYLLWYMFKIFTIKARPPFTNHHPVFLSQLNNFSITTLNTPDSVPNSWSTRINLSLTNLSSFYSTETASYVLSKTFSLKLAYKSAIHMYDLFVILANIGRPTPTDRYFFT